MQVFYGIYQHFLLGMNRTHKTIFLIVTEAKFFFSHRYALIKKLSQQQMKFHIITYFEGSLPPDESNIQYTFLNTDRKKFGLINFLRNSVALHHLIRTYDPDIIYAVSHRSIFLASAANIFNNKISLFAISGMGSMFTKTKLSIRSIYTKFLRFLVIKVYQLAINRKDSYFVLQNNNDLNLLLENKITDESRSFIVPGNGLEQSFFYKDKKNKLAIKFIMISRILRDKGVIEFFDAARKVLTLYPKVSFCLYGSFDHANPNMINAKDLEQYLDSKIYYGGHVDDIRSEIINSSAVVLPSYREGFSKVLMEAQACSRPVITSNVPGCRDAIIENLTGYLIEPKNSDELAEKIILMIENPIQFQAMSRNAYKHAKNCFSVDGAVLKHLDIFKKVTSI
jgi:glycosyltransferase involved in cell wall biosynthesis